MSFRVPWFQWLYLSVVQNYGNTWISLVDPLVNSAFGSKVLLQFFHVENNNLTINNLLYDFKPNATNIGDAERGGCLKLVITNKFWKVSSMIESKVSRYSWRSKDVKSYALAERCITLTHRERRTLTDYWIEKHLPHLQIEPPIRLIERTWCDSLATNSQRGKCWDTHGGTRQRHSSATLKMAKGWITNIIWLLWIRLKNGVLATLSLLHELKCELPS